MGDHQPNVGRSGSEPPEPEAAGTAGTGNGQKIFPRETGWRRVLTIAVLAGTGTTLLAAGLGLILQGGYAAASAAGGGAAIVILSGLTLLLVDWAERHRPEATILLFMIGFLVKLAGLALLLPVLNVPEWVEPNWAVITAAAVVIVWQAAEISAFVKLRFSVTPDG